MKRSNALPKAGIFLDCDPGGGGSYQYALSVLKALSRSEGFELTAFFSNDLWAPVCSGMGIAGYKITENKLLDIICKILRRLPLPFGLYRKLNTLFSSVGRIMKVNKIDFCVYPSQASQSYNYDIKAICAIHDLMHKYKSEFPEVASEITGRDRHFNKLCRWSSAILVDSNMGRQHVIESYPVDEQKIYVLPFIAPDYIYDKPDNFNSAVLLKQYNLPSKYFFYPAQFWLHKNHQNLIKALYALKQSIPDIKMVFVGTQKNANHMIQTLIDECDLNSNIITLGYVTNDEMTALYKNARALIMPTFFGPTNIPQLEAFELGCPVATSGIFGIPEQVGDAALLFDPYSVEEIKECMEKLWMDDTLCEGLAKKGRKHAQQWGQKQFADKLSEILHAVFTGQKV